MSSSAAVKVLEELSVFTPLGIRFWDPTKSEQIRDGLRVLAWRDLPRGQVVIAQRTRSGIYAFQNLPGLRSLEYPTTEAVSPDDSPPETHSFVILVEDTLHRFLPAASRIDLPLPYRGVFPSNGLESPTEASPPGFLLFSAVSRSRPGWLAGIYGDLLDHNSGLPAAHAKLEVQIAGQTVFGLSDADGRFVIYLPYPAIAGDFDASPTPALGFGSLFNQTWGLQLAVYYQPQEQQELPRTSLPDYLSVLTQSQAGVWEQAPATGYEPVLEWSGVLQYGQELNVTTMGEQHLLVSPGISP